MNIQRVKNYIEEYKREFNRVHNDEIYKWHAIKQFQEHFDVNSKDFYSNLEMSLSKSDNLLVSRLYFPKGMLLENVKKTPERVREMFKILYDEDFDVFERVESFRSEFGALSNETFPDKKNHYQDHRAVVVYLTLMYPERYFFYKFGMFKKFADKVEYPYKPVKGRIGNIGQFHSLCELVRYEIEKDQDLLTLHESRLEDDSYRDKNHNILTQDFIYYVAQHLNELPKQETQKSGIISEREVSANELSVRTNNIPNFKPIIINHIQNNIDNKRIGDLGEIWVLKQEKESLKKNGKEELAEKVSHSAKNEGDGLGYDILSYNLNGEKKYIEVKTTKGRKNSTFFISRNELEFSKIEIDNYYLYRVYEFNEETEKAKLLKIKGGDLSALCTPINYEVKLT